MSSKAQNLPATTGLLNTDIIYAVTAPDTVPVDNKMTFGNLRNAIMPNVLYADTFAGADIGAQINAAYAALPSAGGCILVTPGTYSYSTPIVEGTNGKPASIRGFSASATFLKFTPTSGNAITLNFGNPTGHLTAELTGITLMGKSTLVAAAQTNTNTSVGIFYGGNQGCPGINTHDMNVNGFGSNWEIGPNAYMLNFQNCSNSGGNGGQASRGALVHIETASNSGERNNFFGCNFTDPGNSSALNAIYITNTGTASNSFHMCSVDDAQIFIGTNNGQTSITNCHLENAAFATYGSYVLVQGVSSDKATQISFCFNEIANDATSSGNTIVTCIQHGGQLTAIGNHINNYGGQTITNFIDHSLDNGVESEIIGMNQVQGGGLTNLIAGSGGIPYTQSNAACFSYNVGNSYTIGMRALSTNINEFFSGGNTVGSFDHSGNWSFGVSGTPGAHTFYGRILRLALTLASANDVTLGNANAFNVTGTTQINTIVTTGWTSGSQVTLRFSTSLTVKHNTAGAGAVILLAGAVDFSATANDTLELEYDGTSWRQISSAVI